jgi:hypothetical protein
MAQSLYDLYCIIKNVYVVVTILVLGSYGTTYMFPLRQSALVLQNFSAV